MCGIVGYLGSREAFPVIIKGLQRLEYRGYDSAGVMLYDGSEVRVSKTKGKVFDLKIKAESDQNVKGTLGIGHTRWATHGVPNDVNAHPHQSNSGRIVAIHNGIIENYAPIKQTLEKRGYSFKSDTDTEVLVNLIEEIQIKEEVSLNKAVRLALNEVVGAYALVVFDVSDPETLVTARMGSPLAIGVGEDEFFVASDASPFIEFTSNAIYLEDGEMATIRIRKQISVRKISNAQKINPFIHELQLSLDEIEKGGYDHFMLKEIYEQPKAIRDTYRGRLRRDPGLIKMAGVDDHVDKFLNAKRIIIVACGTSWHAGLVGEYLFEDLARINVEVEYASEFRYRNPIINENDTVATEEFRFGDNDTLAALVSNLVDADALILLTDQSGFYTADPRFNDDATLIQECYVDDASLDSMAGGSGRLGQGGMQTKLRAARFAARSGTHTIIANGRTSDVISRAVAGEEIGTWLRPKQPSVKAKKQWLAGLQKEEGRVVIDQGAAEVLRAQGRSLLPVGVVSLQGGFRRGDTVLCVTPEGMPVARGLVNYDAVELSQIKGLSSAEVAGVLGYAGDPEVIHRDNLVLL